MEPLSTKIARERRAAKFNDGQVVRLRSGGPNLTVTSSREIEGSAGAYGVQVAWFSEKDGISHTVLPNYALEDADPASK